MADPDKDDKTVVDIETLSDEDFLKLDVPPAEIVDPDKEKTDESDTTQSTTDDTANAGDQDGAGKGGDTGGGEGEGPTELTDEEKAAAETKAAEEAAAKKLTNEPADNNQEAEKLAAEKKVNDDKETLKLKEETPEAKAEREKTESTAKSETEAQELAKAQEDATTFFDKVSAPFKADGKEVQVRTPEEAVRLMQMGVNYSRRMKEMKPLREMDAMLTAHGLNSPDKLNELIDLSKGSKEAIQKYLKKHNIDPLDLDMEKAEAHSTPNYQSDPKDVAFQDAIDNTLIAPGGKELLADVNRDWDDASKESLRDNPGLFSKLLEQKDTGVYSQIQKELLHQRTMGYLADVPFLQAYEQVGNAMQKAGVFDTKEPTKKTGLAPIASGPRKSADKPKTEQTTPNLSSKSKSTIAVSSEAAKTEPDYLSMSDEDFMKLSQPG